MQPRVAEGPVIGIDDSVLGVGRDDASADEVRRHGCVEALEDIAARDSVDLVGDSIDDIGCRGDVGRCRTGLVLACRELPAPESSSTAGEGERIVDRLHDEGDDSPFTPAVHIEEGEGLAALPDELTCPYPPPSLALLRDAEHRLQQAHRVRALAVPNRFDVRVGVGEEARRDGDALRVVSVGRPGDGPEDRLAVRAGKTTEC
ncbi:unannotated protein [freshwater metagenome]|uniref:Unannotated protein n=1 Tax=freshwater metagenome TaxID=449393 RepID=A0A6J6UJU4_9ZZZZ